MTGKSISKEIRKEIRNREKIFNTNLTACDVFSSEKFAMNGFDIWPVQLLLPLARQVKLCSPVSCVDHASLLHELLCMLVLV